MTWGATMVTRGSATDYVDASRRLLEQADVELAQGDLQQASEKGWGAAAQMIKAVSAQREWRHGSHRNLSDTIARLAEETGDAELHTLYNVANGLHMNFYENWLDGANVMSGIQDIKRLVDKMAPLVI